MTRESYRKFERERNRELARQPQVCHKWDKETNEPVCGAEMRMGIDAFVPEQKVNCADCKAKRREEKKKPPRLPGIGEEIDVMFFAPNRWVFGAIVRGIHGQHIFWFHPGTKTKSRDRIDKYKITWRFQSDALEEIEDGKS